MSLPAAVAAQLRGDYVVAALLVEFGFSTGTERVWNGDGPLITADNKTWLGVGNFGGVDGLSSEADMQASAATFELRAPTGTQEAADFAAAVQADLDADVLGQPITVYIQTINGETSALIDEPVALWAGLMSHIEADWPSIAAARIVLTAENVFAEKRKPQHGMMTASDQRALFPGDSGLDYVESLVNRRVIWPRD